MTTPEELFKECRGVEPKRVVVVANELDGMDLLAVAEEGKNN